MKKTSTLPHWLIVACCCALSTACFGLGSNSLGLFNGPVAAYFGAGIGDVSVYLTISNLLCGFLGPLVLVLSKRVGVRWVIAIGGFGLAVSFVLMTAMTSLWQMYVLGVIAGVSKALIGSVMLGILLGNWFHKRMGFTMGLALGATGVTAAVFNPLLDAVITHASWRAGYAVCALLTLAFIVPCVLYVREMPSERGLQPYGYDPAKQPASEQPKAEKKESDRLELSLPLFLIMSISLLGHVLVSVGSHLPTFAVSIGLSSAVGASLVSMMMIGNTGLKVVMGALCDSIGSRRAWYLILSIAGVGLLMLATSSSPIVLMIGALLAGASYSMGSVGMATVCRDVFGSKSNSAFAGVGIFSNAGNAIGNLLLGYAYDGMGTYRPALFVCVGVCALCAVYMTLAYKKRLHS